MLPPAQIRADQIRTLYDQSAPVLIANVINVAILVVASWPTASHAGLVAWASLVLLMTVVRVLLRQAYRRARPTAEAAAVWGQRFVLGSLTAGLLWGAAGFWLFDAQNLLSQILITFAIGGMGAGAAGTLSCYLPAFYAFLVPAVAPLFVRVVGIGDDVHFAMGAMILIYIAGLSAVARNTNRVVTHAFRLRFENETLLERLAAAQLRLEATNRTLEDKVAERTAAFEAQSEALRSAQRLEAVGRLAGGVAHDFNNLLTVIMGNTTLLLDEPLPPDVRAAVAETRLAAEHGADLVRQLLAFGRRQVLAPVQIDLNVVVNETRPLLERLLAGDGAPPVVMELDLSPRALWVMIDRAQIEQVLVNLVTNARDAMPAGGSIAIKTASIATPGPDGRAERSALLSVSDTGIGMDDETRRHAFEPFFTTKSVGRGTGLGLATVHGIVEQSGGTIDVSSAPGQGTVFSVTLPETGAADDLAPALAAREPMMITSAVVLLAEDNPVVRNVTERMLARMGHRVLTADSGEDALARSRDFPDQIDLLVTDVSMGGMDGVELANTLIAERPGLSALLISGYSWDRRLPEQGGTVDFLQKPFSSQALADRVEKLLAHAARRAEIRQAAGQEAREGQEDARPERAPVIRVPVS